MKRSYYAVMRDPKGYLNPDQIHPIIEASPEPFRLLFLTAWNTGRRVSELTKSPDVKKSHGIRKRDIDLMNNRIRFVTLKNKGTDGDHMWVDGVDPIVIEKLWDRVRELGPSSVAFPFTRQVATMRFLRICRSIGIQQIGATPPHMHHLRHSAIMFMYANGMTPEQIQYRTGHRDINSLLYYIRVLEVEDLTEKFRKMWSGESEWIKKIY